VAIIDLVAAVLLILYVVRAVRRPRDPKRTADAIDKMSKLSSSPAIAIVAAGATLANPGGFIPIALKDISQLNPSAGEYIALWLAFTIVSLLPLLAALVALLVSHDWAETKLKSARGWLERKQHDERRHGLVSTYCALLGSVCGMLRRHQHEDPGIVGMIDGAAADFELAHAFGDPVCLVCLPAPTERLILIGQLDVPEERKSRSG
jgi:hypothetical protein